MPKRIIAFAPADYAETLEIARGFFAPCMISRPTPQVGEEWFIDVEGASVPDGPSPARFLVERHIESDGSVTRRCRIEPLA